jgi:multidrug resistance efflux pump
MSLRSRTRIAGIAWGCGVVLALAWSLVDRSSVAARGVGYAPRVVVASEDGGRLMHIDVSLHARVRAGDVVARLDPSVVDQEREVLSAEMLAVQEAEAIRVATEANSLARDIEGMMLERARIASALQEDRAARDGLRSQLMVERDLAGRGASSSEKVALIEQELAVLEAGIVTRESALAMASQAADRARAGRSSAIDNPWAVVAAARRLEAVEGQRQRLDLTAQIDGQVVWIFRTPGEVVLPGDPILEIAPPETAEIVAWVDPARVAGLSVGDGATVVRADGAELSGTLESLGGSVREMPVRLWSVPGWPQSGVPVRVHLNDGAVAPDEPLTVRL